jgi:hypothetical protein
VLRILENLVFTTKIWHTSQTAITIQKLFELFLQGSLSLRISVSPSPPVASVPDCPEQFHDCSKRHSFKFGY